MHSMLVPGISTVVAGRTKQSISCHCNGQSARVSLDSYHHQLQIRYGGAGRCYLHYLGPKALRFVNNAETEPRYVTELYVP